MTLDTNAESLTLGNHAHKYDLVNNKRFTHDLGKNVKGGETVFAPKSKDSDEDDGWILMLAYEEETEKSKLLIIDSQDFESPPVAEIYTPQRIPYGAHGSWMPK